jgi:VWFA-related protein
MSRTRPALRLISFLAVGAAAALLAGSPRRAQDAPAPAAAAQTPAPVEIPVRVSGADGLFVDSLGLDDFVLTEDGIPQTVEGFYMVRGQALAGRGGKPPDNPVIARHYYLLFQAVDYDSKYAEIVETVFKGLLRPGDTMTLMTPVKTYGLSPQALRTKSKDALCKEMIQILRKDIQMGASDYRSLLRDLKRLVKSIEGDTSAFDADLETDATTTSTIGLEVLLERYRDSLRKMEEIRLIDERRLLTFASALRAQSGRKNVFLLYQREFRPEINQTVLNTMMSMYQEQHEVLAMLMELFQFYRRETSFNQERLSRAFADADLGFNLIFMNKQSQYVFGANMREQSEDVYSVFSQIAGATGGLCETAANAATSFKKAAASSDDYYLVYYTPLNTARDKTFRNVRVAVKRTGITVSHRLGYYAF